MFDLSKDADALVCVLYKAYAEQVGEGKEQSDVAHSLDRVKQESFTYWDESRFGASHSELERMNLIKSNDTAGVQLTDDAVEYMKQRFGTDPKEVANYLKRIRSVFWSK